MVIKEITIYTKSINNNGNINIFKTVKYADENTEINTIYSQKRDLTDNELNEIMEEIEHAGSISTDDFPLKNIRESIYTETGFL